MVSLASNNGVVVLEAMHVLIENRFELVHVHVFPFKLSLRFILITRLSGKSSDLSSMFFVLISPTVGLEFALSVVF